MINLSGFVIAFCALDYFRKREFLQSTIHFHSHREQFRHIVHFVAAIHEKLDASHSTALHAHFLSMRQRPVDMQFSKRKNEIFPQQYTQPVTTLMCQITIAGNDFTLGNIMFFGLRASRTMSQNGLFERAIPRDRCCQRLPIRCFIHCWRSIILRIGNSFAYLVEQILRMQFRFCKDHFDDACRFAG
ncbi:MAG: hypothetical protein ACOY9D_10060 [Pseudomonadota bacterium]